MVTVLFMSPGADQPTTLGQKTFDFEFSSPTGWSRIDFLNPLMGLRVAVLCADGPASPRGEKIILTFFKESFDPKTTTGTTSNTPDHSSRCGSPCVFLL